MCGLVGDTKPQFSIIGTHVEKAAAICRLAPPGNIYISNKSYKTTVNKVNNFIFEAKEVMLDGSLQTIFSVKKRRGMNRRLAY